MYDYRQMSPEQRERILTQRRSRGFPWHGPPHFGGEETVFLVSAACYEHNHILNTPKRLSEFAEALLSGLETAPGVEVNAWVVLPNHYHFLARLDLDALSPWLGRMHNGKSTQWNREDGTPNRKVWHRFFDRQMRSERHYHATLNYIHANPVKHGCVEKATDWPWCSLHDYLEEYGRDAMAKWWRQYPVRDYGKGWDDY